MEYSVPFEHWRARARPQAEAYRIAASVLYSQISLRRLKQLILNRGQNHTVSSEPTRVWLFVGHSHVYHTILHCDHCSGPGVDVKNLLAEKILAETDAFDSSRLHTTEFV